MISIFLGGMIYPFAYSFRAQKDKIVNPYYYMVSIVVSREICIDTSQRYRTVIASWIRIETYVYVILRATERIIGLGELIRRFYVSFTYIGKLYFNKHILINYVVVSKLYLLTLLL